MVAKRTNRCAIAPRHPDLVQIDDWCNPNLLRAVAAEWPDQEWPFWFHSDDGAMASVSEVVLPASVARVVRQMHDLRIDQILGCTDAIVGFDSDFARMHCLPRRSHLDLHRDVKAHYQTALHRVAAAMLFIDPDWKSNWGGQLEVWTDWDSGPNLTVEPVWNKLVVFRSTELLHGIPTPVGCPADQSLKVIQVSFWATEPDQKSTGSAASGVGP